MNFESGHTYHVFNQGNNRQKIFYSKDNYFYFIKKIKDHILPFARVLNYCLMPNHFHLLIEVENLEVLYDSKGKIMMNYSLSDVKKNKVRDLNNSIGIMLRSYTRAINRSQVRSGSLFRSTTKSKDINEFKGPSANFYTIEGVHHINVNRKSYLDICKEYIDDNPVKAGLVFNPGDWEYSSAYELKNKKFRLLKKVKV